jgi:aminomuconate-semialdehyde/2-hydroxymuconate-6-semialdehyde dehydrogenase
MTRFDNFIANEFVEPVSRDYLDVIEPATGIAYAKVAHSDEQDVARAVEAARSAFPAWAATPAQERGMCLMRLADLLDANVDALAQAESRNCGKPVALARSIDIPRSSANLRFFASAILHTRSEFCETDQPAVGPPARALNYTLRRPRGVAGLIAPWNLPLYLLTWKVAPAVATGNTCVAKPSELTPETATLFAGLVARAGFPPGVINIIHGTGAACGRAIVEHPDVPAISFTGSTAVGRWIGETCGRMLKRVSLELGGKNPMIIFDDADVDEAVDLAVRASFTNQGQVCLCASRILVHQRVHDRFLAALVARAGELRPGDPADPQTRYGALISRAHLEKVRALVADGRASGGVIHCGGRVPDASDLPGRCRNGYFYLPTVISSLPHACRTEREEIFGPVATVRAFEHDEDAVTLANDTDYGLAAVICTRDVKRAHHTAAALNAGVIWVNAWLLRDLRTPFGGMKASGVGREGGLEALHFFTEPRNICVRIG